MGFYTFTPNFQLLFNGLTCVLLVFRIREDLVCKAPYLKTVILFL